MIMASRWSLIIPCLLALLAVLVSSESHGNGDDPGRLDDDDEHPVVQTGYGSVLGSVMTSWSGYKFFSFRGVRFAEAPVNELRFKAPVPPKAWTGVADATKDGPPCPQPLRHFYGNASEDCLFLNVYTRGLSNNFPVLVFFHAGGFFSMTSRSDALGPQYMLDKDVVVVTVNSRLGALGYLTTEDEHAVGNYGLKDQVMALRWVRDNIANFGGDPKSVTIAGYSVGSTSVVLHMLSPMSKGLFHRAVGMSAGVTAKWVVQEGQAGLARKLGRLAGCSPNADSQQLIDCLRQVPAQTLADYYSQLREWGSDPAIVYSVTVEKDLGGGEERFLTEDPVTLIRGGKFVHVPLVMGITEKEFQSRADAIIQDDKLRHDLNNDFERVGPIAFYYERGTQRSKDISTKIREFYLKGQEIQKDTEEVGQIYSDSTLIYDTVNTARLLANHSRAPVFFYMSNYVGRLSFEYKRGTNIPVGVVHMDDLNYIFHLSRNFPEMFKGGDPESGAVHTYTSMLANFASSGDPTPSTATAGFNWIPMTADLPQYLDIGNEGSGILLMMKEGLPFPERMQFWEAIYASPS